MPAWTTDELVEWFGQPSSEKREDLFGWMWWAATPTYGVPWDVPSGTPTPEKSVFDLPATAPPPTLPTIDLDLGGGNGGTPINWWDPFLTGELALIGGLLAAPTVVDTMAAFVGSGKKKKGGRDPKILADGMRKVAEGMRHSAQMATPEIVKLVTNPLIMMPLAWLNLEALHQKNLIDEGIAHTMESFMSAGLIAKMVGDIIPG